MKKYTKQFLLLLVVIALFFGFQTLKTKNQNTSIQNEKVVQEFKANLTINYGTNSPSFNVSQFIGRTVLEATQTVLSGKMKATGENENAFVTSLNGRDANSKKREFWELLVNGKQAEVGAGTYKIQNGDEIVWKMSTY
jgi:hypothetical protein